MTQQHYSLVRRLGFASATTLVVSNMIGTGVFTTTGFLAGDLGRPWLVLLSWLVGAVCALLGAICYSELAVNFPTSGGEYVYLSQAYGATWGFVSGWVSLVAGFSAPIAATALAFASYATFLFPTRHSAGGASPAFRFGSQQIIALLAVAIFAVWNFFGIRRIARVQNILTALKLALIGGFVFSALLFGHGDWQNLFRTTVRWTGIPVWQQFAISLFWVYVAYSGWNAAVYVAEEIDQPERTLSRALAIGTGVVAMAYILLNVVFLYAVPLESMKGVIAVGALSASPFRLPNRNGVQRVDGVWLAIHHECHDYRRSACLLCNGTRWAIPNSRSKGSSPLAHSSEFHCCPSSVHHAARPHAVSCTGHLYRFLAQPVHNLVSGLTICFQATAWMASLANRQFRFSADPLPLSSGECLDDDRRAFPKAAHLVAYPFDSRHWGATALVAMESS
jgi:hypothetical protein